MSEQRAYEAGLAAYIAGYPLVVMRRTQALQTCGSGVNTFLSHSRLFTPEDRDVVTPNNDTIYSNTWLDLRPGPQLLTMPAASPERYFSFQFLDMYTGVFEVAHGSSDGASQVLLVGPNRPGTGPAGVRVVQSPTPDVWMIGRTFVQGPDDLAAAQEFQESYGLSGPAGTPVVPAGTDRATLPTPQSVGADGASFFDELAEALTADPPTTEEEARIYRAVQEVGPRNGPEVGAGLARAVADGQARILARVRTRDRAGNGWSWSLGHGVWGDDYLRRAAIAYAGLGALPATEAIYYRAAATLDDAPLTGTTPYRLHFDAGALPPVEATGFWSVTMYDAETRMLVANPIGRYAINSADPGVVRNQDGSLDLYLQHDAPAGRESNWLPAPSSAYYVILRVYVPQQSALDGGWLPPALSAC